jgi:thiamine-monophosphate kinase
MNLNMSDIKRTDLKELGEFGLINKIKDSTTIVNDSTLKGIGDDAAVIAVGDTAMLVSTDMLVEGIHFDLSFTPLRHLGYKAVAVNVSDIAAMNATAQQITVSLALSNRFSVEAIDELYDGIRQACENYKVDLVGGDTTSSTSGLVISITAIGTAPKTTVVYRENAKEGDIICVSGDLGGAYMGLQVLAREKQVYLANPQMQPELTGKEYIVKRQLKPEARMDIIYDLREAGVKPTAMIDVSDGLASELLHLCKSSGTGAVILESKIPVDTETGNTADEFKLDATTCALNGGEDYELLFTISQADYDKIKNHADITAIGVMKKKEDGVLLLTNAGNSVAIKAQGWVHF